MRATEIIELVGGEVTWELVCTDGRWFGWASHHGLSDSESFKFTESGESLDYVIRRIANMVLAWQEQHGWKRP